MWCWLLRGLRLRALLLLLLMAGQRLLTVQRGRRRRGRGRHPRAGRIMVVVLNDLLFVVCIRRVHWQIGAHILQVGLVAEAHGRRSRRFRGLLLLVGKGLEMANKNQGYTSEVHRNPSAQIPIPNNSPSCGFC